MYRSEDEYRSLGVPDGGGGTLIESIRLRPGHAQTFELRARSLGEAHREGDR
jgi:hypothetical protein